MDNQLSFDLEVKKENGLSDFTGPGWSTLIDATRQLHVGLISQMYIYGGTGSGKTHFLKAVCESYIEAGSSAICLSLKDLVDTNVEVLASLESFDFVAIDDLEAIHGRKDWQEAIFHLINRSSEGEGQWMFAAQTHASALPFELTDLITRLQRAASFKVPEGQDKADRKAMLESVLRRRGWQFDERITDYLLEDGPHRIGPMLEVLNAIQPLFSNRNRAHVSKAMISEATAKIDEYTLLAELSDINQEAQTDQQIKDDSRNFETNNLTLDF